MHTTAFGATFSLVGLGNVRIGIGGYRYVGAIGGEGTSAVVAVKDAVESYGIGLPIEYELTHFIDGAELGILIEPGIEIFSLVSENRTRPVIKGGPTFDARLSERFTLRLAPEAGVFLKTIYHDYELPEGATMHPTWWLTLRVGLNWVLGSPN
jgi:hypothetical protein